MLDFDKSNNTSTLTWIVHFILDEDPCKNFSKQCVYACDLESQRCLCPMGYELDDDQQSCIGMICQKVYTQTLTHAL